MALCFVCCVVNVHGFTTIPTPQLSLAQLVQGGICSSSSALRVWWFGGTENSSSEINKDGDSCELVAVRIERTSANSRKISGSIIVQAPLQDVWAILTDYDRLAIHVPNLVESRIVSRQTLNGEQGDGLFRCKLFQKGAQKIVGFEFGASVTMQMTEQVIKDSSASGQTWVPQERSIGFTCVDSFFFSEFDGEWRAKEEFNTETREVETELNYVVDVRPKGPVPVAALEWRIREDVPTNLRAVKKAAMEVGLEGVLASRKRSSSSLAKRNSLSVRRVRSNYMETPKHKATNAIRRAKVRTRATNSVAPSRRSSASGAASGGTNIDFDKSNNPTPRKSSRAGSGATPQASIQKKEELPLPLKVMWDSDETMEAYLRE